MGAAVLCLRLLCLRLMPLKSFGTRLAAFGQAWAAWLGTASGTALALLLLSGLLQPLIRPA